MSTSLFSLQYLIAALVLWLNHQQQEVIDYLEEEYRMLKAKLGGWKVAFTDTERRRLAIRAKALGRKLLGEIDTLFTPDTLLRWPRELVAHVLRENGIDPAPCKGNEPSGRRTSRPTGRSWWRLTSSASKSGASAA